jgi:aminopeptidase N
MKYLCTLVFCSLFFVNGPNVVAATVVQQISEQTSQVDILRIQATLTPTFETRAMYGKVTVTFRPLFAVKEIRLDAQKMKVSNGSENASVTATDTQILITGDFKAHTDYQVSFEYNAQPKKALYVVNHQGEHQLWTQGQGKYTSNWLPSIDDMNDKIEFDLTVVAPHKYTVISNGNVLSIEERNKTKIWRFDMTQSMSSYLVALAIGMYEVAEELSSSGVPLQYYYYPTDSLKVEPTYRYSKRIFDFFETEIGIPYPWQNYKQVPVKDFLYAGMENTGTTLFSDSFVVDSLGFEDRNYVNVNAHELAHQWFGNLVTETKSEHHWLHEGFATYYALLAERTIFGEDYFYYKLYQTAEQLKELSDMGKGQKLVAAGGSSLNYYQKGAWALHILREKVGEDAFAKAVQAYLTKFAYTNVTTEDFMSEVALASGMDLTAFTKDWLYQGAFQADDALNALKKSFAMKRYFEVQALRAVPMEQKVNQLALAIASDEDYTGQEAVYQLAEASLDVSKVLYETAIESSNLFIRQAVAESIPPEHLLKLPSFDALLTDVSYVTRELALFKKWLALRKDPRSGQKQGALLDRTDGVFGFSDGNIRTMWLALSLITPAYNEDEEAVTKRYNELKSYTAPWQPFQLRQQAFQYLAQIQIFEPDTLRNLVEACAHANWRFRESARSLLTQVLENERWKAMLITNAADFNEKEKAYLKKIGLKI